MIYFSEELYEKMLNNIKWVDQFVRASRCSCHLKGKSAASIASARWFCAAQTFIHWIYGNNQHQRMLNNVHSLFRVLNRLVMMNEKRLAWRRIAACVELRLLIRTYNLCIIALFIGYDSVGIKYTFINSFNCFG